LVITTEGFENFIEINELQELANRDIADDYIAHRFMEASPSAELIQKHRTEEEKMAVIIQELIGSRYGSHYYPAISGVAQSYNFYPFAEMGPQDGIACIALEEGLKLT
jgi:hypothetical protein